MPALRLVAKASPPPSYPEIALLEPLSVCLHATLRAELKLGQPVLITGAGPIGVVQLLCAHASGCSPIVITDLSAERLEFAKNLVPSVLTYTVNTKTEPQEAAREIVKLFSDAAGMGSEVMPAVTMECTGVESSIAVASCKHALVASSSYASTNTPSTCRCNGFLGSALRHRRGQVTHPDSVSRASLLHCSLV